MKSHLPCSLLRQEKWIEGLQVIWAFICFFKPPFVPLVLICYKTNMMVGALILPPQQSPSQMLVWVGYNCCWQSVICDCHFRGFGELAAEGLPYSHWLKARTRAVRHVSPILMFKVVLTWCGTLFGATCTNQVKVIQHEVEVWLWEDTSCPCSWLRIYKHCYKAEQRADTMQAHSWWDITIANNSMKGVSPRKVFS